MLLLKTLITLMTLLKISALVFLERNKENDTMSDEPLPSNIQNDLFPPEGNSGRDPAWGPKDDCRRHPGLTAGFHPGALAACGRKSINFGQPREAFLSVFTKPQHLKFRARKLAMEANIKLSKLK